MLGLLRYRIRAWELYNLAIGRGEGMAPSNRVTRITGAEVQARAFVHLDRMAADLVAEDAAHLAEVIGRDLEAPCHHLQARDDDEGWRPRLPPFDPADLIV